MEDVDLNKRMVSLQIDSTVVQHFKQLAKDIPCFARFASEDIPLHQKRAINQQIYTTFDLNVGGSLSALTISKYRCSGDGKGGKGAAFVSRIITYVANLVKISVLLDGTPQTNCSSWIQWKDTLHSWVMDTFRQACIRLLSPDYYKRSLWNGGDNPLEEAIASFGLEPNEIPPTDATVTNMRVAGGAARCDKCFFEILQQSSGLTCAFCGVARCKPCFGIDAHSRLRDQKYLCEWCLERHQRDSVKPKALCAKHLSKESQKPCTTLLQPNAGFTLCNCCGCDLTDPNWASWPARCRYCHRMFCEREVASCSADLAQTIQSEQSTRRRKTSGSTKTSLEKSRSVALISCVFCVGRESFAQNRIDTFKRMVRNAFPSCRDPLAIQDSDTIKRSELQRASLKGPKNSPADAIAELVYDLHYAGVRTASSQCLHFVLKMVSAQVLPENGGPVLPSSVSPFNMLHLMGQHALANHKMLETVCLAQASCSEKEGSTILGKIGSGLEPLQPFHDGNTKKRVGFYGENLFKVGPLLDLVGQAIVTLSKSWSEQFEVFVFGVGCESDKSYPPLKELWGNFKKESRICFDSKVADASYKLQRFRAAKLDVFISLPGWTGSEDLGPILHCRVAPVQFNWLEFASIMYAPGLVDYTIVGQAVGNEQRNCRTRERLADIVSPGTYQPVQSFALLAAVQSRPVKKDRAHWGLPVGKFILFLAGATNRLDFSRFPVHPLWDMARQIPFSIILFLDKPAGMRGYIEENLAQYNASHENRLKVDPSRLYFLPWMHDKGDFWELIEAVGHEGGRGTTVDSFGSVTFHTGAGDAAMMCVPHFTPRNPNGTMQQRVASEIVTAVGLESQCVGDTPADTVQKVVSYAHDRDSQDRMIGHMKRGREEQIGYWDVERCPRFLTYAITNAYDRVKAAGGDRTKLEDFTIPFEAGAMEALASDDPATSNRYRILKDAHMPDELFDVTAGMLEAIEMQGGSLLKLEGMGSFTFAILAKFDSQPNITAVIKISKTGVFPGQMHNTPLFREAKAQGEWHKAMRQHTFVGLLPKPCEVLDDGVFFGHSRPNKDGRVVPFLICEYIPRSFSEVAGMHREHWQESKLLTDSLRVQVLQPISQGLFWAQHNGRMMLIFRDLKPENVRFREDGSMAVVDLGSSATFSMASKGSGLRRMVSIVERQPTVPGGQRRGAGLLRGQSRHGDKYVGIPFSAIEKFCMQTGDRGLALIGATTPAFKDRELKHVEKSFRLAHSRVQPRFDANYGCWQDSYAFFRMVLFDLTRMLNQDIADWSQQADEAARQGVDGIKRMLLGAAVGGQPQEPQQPQAFGRLADFLYRGLCSRGNGHQTERLGIMGAVTHLFTTLAILTPDQEKLLSSPEGIPFPHGAVAHKSWPTGFLNSLSAAARAKAEMIPKLSYVNQPGMGGGLVALEDVPGDALLGVYVGRRVRNNICGTLYDAREFPSRYNVTGQGSLRIFTQLHPETKFTCDAQLDLQHDMTWCQLVGNSGPFINAAESQKLANCIVDRRSAWYDEDTGLIWMLVWSKAAGMQKGKYCSWYYKFKAGAGKLWHFDN